jgi:Leucine-rich repeat (LRR) protein
MPICPFKKVDMSGCAIRFLNPNAISSFKLLTDIDLSRNKLNIMMAEDSSLFEKLFTKLSNLRTVRLASNELTRLPKYIFAYNLRLEFIDISDNHITKFSCEVNHLTHLRTVDVRENRIQIMDAATFNKLNNVQLLLLY